jgi:TrpR-related protein YerC/YecD
MKLHRNVTPRQELAAERKLFAAMAALKSSEECQAFFRDLCTPAEIQAMADRWAVVDYIRRGLPYREIHKITGVSVTTIGRVAKFVAAGNGGYELALRRIEPGTRRSSDDKNQGDPGSRRAPDTAKRAQDSARPNAGGARPAETRSRRNPNGAKRVEAARHG